MQHGNLVTTRKRRRGDAFIKRARELIDGGEGYEAREELMAMGRRYPGISRGGETSLLIAESFYVDGNYGRAEGWVRSLLEWKPDYVEAWELLAEVLSIMDDRIDELEEVVAHTLELCPESFAARVSLTFGYSACGRYADAVRVAKELTEKWPDNPLSWDHLGYEQYFAEQYEDSLASWKRKLELAPDDDRAPHWIETIEHAIAAKAGKGIQTGVSTGSPN